MSTIYPRWEGFRIVQGIHSHVEAEYNIHGEDDEFVAQADLVAALSTFVGGMVLQEVQIIERISEDAWVGRARWAQLAPQTSGSSKYAFDTTGGTAHVTQSIDTLSATPAPGVSVAPDFQGLIGVTAQGVEGVDIEVPNFAFEETHYLDASVISGAYISTLFALTGKVGSTSYKGFSAGELLFRGAVGQLHDWTTWEIAYKFAASPNVTSLPVGPITVPLKRGWDYLWVLNHETDDGGGFLTKRPVAAYVEQVRFMADLSLLGI